MFNFAKDTHNINTRSSILMYLVYQNPTLNFVWFFIQDNDKVVTDKIKQLPKLTEELLATNEIYSFLWPNNHII